MAEKNEYIFSQFFFKKIRGNNYNIFNGNIFKHKQIGMKTPILTSPFGIEKYLNKHIINIEFTNLKENNDVYNFYAKIQQIDDFFKKIKWNKNILNLVNNKIPQELINKIQNKNYISCIRQRANFDPLLRVHLLEKKNVYITKFHTSSGSNIANNLFHFNNTNEKKVNKIIGEFIITFGNLWITDSSYGLTLFLKSFQEHNIN